MALLQGCVQRVFFGHVNEATARVLAAEGFEVHVPRLPRCCGALQLHAGERGARALAKATIEALEGYETIVVNSAGCGSAMKDYGHVLRDEPGWAERAERFSAKVRDVTRCSRRSSRARRAAPLPMRLAYHDACHLAHAQGVRSQPRALLRGIPELELLEPADWEICCGSAGVYNLLKPEPAAELGRRKARQPAGHRRRGGGGGQPGLCAPDHLTHAAACGTPLPVYHPLELLARSIARGRVGDARSREG